MPSRFIVSGWSALLAAAVGAVAVQFGMSNGADWLQVVGLILIATAVCLAVASLFSRPGPLSIIIAVIACVPAALFVLLMYRLSGDSS